MTFVDAGIRLPLFPRQAFRGCISKDNSQQDCQPLAIISRKHGVTVPRTGLGYPRMAVPERTHRNRSIIGSAARQHRHHSLPGTLPLGGLRGRVQGSGFRVLGAGLRIQGAGLRVQVSGFRFQGSEFRFQASAPPHILGGDVTRCVPQNACKLSCVR